MVVSLGGFAFLQFHPLAQQARLQGDEPHSKKHADEEAPLVTLSMAGEDALQPPISSQELSRREIVLHVWQYLACQLILAAFSFGVLPSVMSYVYRKFAVRALYIRRASNSLLAVFVS